MIVLSISTALPNDAEDNWVEALREDVVKLVNVSFVLGNAENGGKNAYLEVAMFM